MDTAQLGGVAPQKASVEVAPSQTAEQAALAALPALASLPLSQRLGQLPVEFMVRRRFRLWFMDQHKVISSEKAAGMVGQNPRLRVRATPEAEPQPVNTQQDVEKLEALHGRGAPDDLGAELKRLAARKDITFSVNGFPVDAYGAYNYLTTGFPAQEEKPSSVTVRCGQIPVRALQPGAPEMGQLDEAVAAVQAKAGDPVAVLEHLVSFHGGTRGVGADLARLERGPEGAAYGTLRRGLENMRDFPRQITSAVGAFKQGTVPERIGLLEAAGFLTRSEYYGYDYGKLAKAHDALLAGGNSVDLTHKLCSSFETLEANQWNGVMDELASLGSASREQLELFVKLAQRNDSRHSGQAARVLAGPAGNLSETDRIKMFEGLKGDAGRRSEAWALVQADLADGKTPSEATARANKLIEAHSNARGSAMACAAEQPDRLEHVLQALKAGIQPDHVRAILEIASGATLPIVLPFGNRALEAGKPFLQKLDHSDRHPSCAQELAGLAQSCARLKLQDLEPIAADWRPDAARTKALSRLVDLGMAAQAVPVLHQLESWPGNSTLAERIDAMEAVGAGKYEYYHLSNQEGGRQAAGEAFKALLHAGHTLPQARARLEKLTAQVYQGYESQQAVDGMRAIVTHARNAGALEVFARLAESGQGVPNASQCTDLLTKPAGKSSQPDRIGASLDLGLVELGELGSRQALIGVVAAELAGGASREQAVAGLKKLVATARQQRSIPTALAYVQANLGERDRMTTLLEAGFPASVAAATLTKAAGGSLTPLLPLGNLKNYLSPETVQAFQDIPKSDPATLTRLCQGFASRSGLQAGPWTELYSQSLKGNREATEVAARLLEQCRFSTSEAATLFAILEPPAGSTTLTQRLDALIESGGLLNDYYRAGYYSVRANAHAEALVSQVRGGHSLQDASSVLKRVWNQCQYETQDAETILGRLTELGGATDRRDFLMASFEGGNNAAWSISAEKLVEPAAGKSTYGQRVAAFNALKLSQAEIGYRDSVFKAYRAELDGGAGQDFTLQRLGGLQKASEKWDVHERKALFDYVARSHPGAPEVAALHDQLLAGVKPSVAVAALARTSDLSRLKGLKGLGQAGRGLDDSVAAEFQKHQEAALDRGVAEGTVTATLERATRAVGGQRLTSEARLKAAQYWGDKLTDRPESNEVFARLLESGQPVETCIALLEQMEQPAGRTTQTGRFELYKELGGLDRDYYQPGYTQQRATMFYSAVGGALSNGVGADELKKQIPVLWAAADYDKDELRPLLERYVEVSGSSGERSNLIGLLQGGWPRDQVVTLCGWLHANLGSTDFADRKRAFDLFGLAPGQSAGLKRQVQLSLQAEVEAGRGLGTAASDMKSLVAGMKDDLARRTLSVYTGALVQAPQLRGPFRELVTAGVPPEVAGSVLTEAPADKVRQHTELVACLGGYGEKLSLNVAQSFIQANGDQKELRQLATTLAAGKLDTAEPLEYYTQKLVGSGAPFHLYLNLLTEFPRYASQAHSALELTGDDPTERFQALKAAGCYKTAAENDIPWLVDSQQQLLDSARVAGVSRADALSVVKSNFGYRGWELHEVRPAYACLLEKPADMMRWNTIITELGQLPRAYATLKELPSDVLDLYANIRQAGMSPQDSLSVLGGIASDQAGSSLEDRRQAYEKLAQVSSVDGRSLGRRAWSTIVNLSDVTTGTMPVLVEIYNKVVNLGQPSARAAELVCSIYAQEQAKGVTPGELAKSLDRIAEVAKLDIRPDTGVAVLRDEADRVVFSGVTVKKRKAPTQ